MTNTQAASHPHLTCHATCSRSQPARHAAGSSSSRAERLAAARPRRRAHQVLLPLPRHLSGHDTHRRPRGADLQSALQQGAAAVRNVALPRGVRRRVLARARLVLTALSRCALTNQKLPSRAPAAAPSRALQVAVQVVRTATDDMIHSCRGVSLATKGADKKSTVQVVRTATDDMIHGCRGEWTYIVGAGFHTTTCIGSFDQLDFKHGGYPASAAARQAAAHGAAADSRRWRPLPLLQRPAGAVSADCRVTCNGEEQPFDFANPPKFYECTGEATHVRLLPASCLLSGCLCLRVRRPNV